MVSISYFFRYGFGPSSSHTTTGSTCRIEGVSNVSAAVSTTLYNTAGAVTDNDFKLLDTFLPNLDLADSDTDNGHNVQANSHVCFPGSTSSDLCEYQPWKTTIWKPYGIGRDLPWTPNSNTWDSLLCTPPRALTPPIWTGTPKLQQPRPYRPAPLIHLQEIASTWIDAYEASVDATRDASSSASPEMPPCAQGQRTVNNANGSRPEKKSGSRVTQGAFRKQDNCYKSPDPRDLPPPNFSLNDFKRSR